MSGRCAEYSLMPCQTCRSFHPEIKVDTMTRAEVAGGCDGCGIIYYGQVVECALHKPFGDPERDFRYYDRKREEFAKKYPDLAKHGIYHVGELYPNCLRRCREEDKKAKGRAK